MLSTNPEGGETPARSSLLDFNNHKIRLLKHVTEEEFFAYVLSFIAGRTASVTKLGKLQQYRFGRAPERKLIGRQEALLAARQGVTDRNERREDCALAGTDEFIKNWADAETGSTAPAVKTVLQALLRAQCELGERLVAAELERFRQMKI